MQDYNQYFIHRQPTRTQVASHYHSTLEQPNLENIESMLAATRQRNYELGAQYFQSKYGNSREYTQLMESMGLDPPPDPHPKERDIHDFRNSREYGDYVRATLQQKKNQIVEAVAQAALESKPVKPTVTYNPWTDGATKKPSTVAEKQQQQQQFLNKFERFRQNKQKRVSPQAKVQPVSKPAPKRNYKQQLIVKIYREIDRNGKGHIDKMQLLEYLTANKKVTAIFNLRPESLAAELYEYSTVEEDVMTLNELLEYFGQQALDISQHQNQEAPSQLHEAESKLMKNCCLLNPEDIKLFERLFAETDVHSDMLVNRKTYLHHVLNNIQVRQLLLKPAMLEPRVNRTILLYRMLDKIEVDGDIGTEQERKTKEYISFKQFMGYFERPSASSQGAARNQEDARLVKFIDSLNNRSKSNPIDLPEEVVRLLQDIIKTIPHTSQTFFKTLTFIERLRSMEGYDLLRDQIARRGGESDGLQSESVDEVLDRMLKEAHEYIELPELLMFFSRRGRPIEYYKQKDETKRKLEESMKGSKILAQEYSYLRRDENQQVLAYDSDPEVYNGSAIHQSRKEEGFRASRLKESSPNKSKGKPLATLNANNVTAAKNIHGSAPDKSNIEIGSNPQFKGTFVSMIVDDEPQATRVSKNEHEDRQLPRAHSASHSFKVTVPEPFSFEAREGLIRTKKESEVHVPEPSKPQTTLKAKQVPKTVKQVGLFDKIMAENERRREETKRNSMMMTLANERPFSFQNRQHQKARRKTQQQREQFVFKAKPVPWYCSVDLVKKQNEQDLIKRKEKVSRMAQQSLALSKLPPRMEKNEMEKKAEKLREGGDYVIEEEKVSRKKVKDPPDFQKLQKAMEEELERKKLNKKTTKPIGFNFHSASKPKDQENSDKLIVDEAAKNSERIDPLKAARKIMQTIEQCSDKQPKVRAASTIKFDQQVQKRRKYIQQQKEKDALKNKLDPPQFVSDLKPKLLTADCVVQASTHKLTEKEIEMKQSKKDQEEADKKKFKQWKDGVIERAKAQPLLVNRPLKRDEQMDRMKKLALISATLEQNGVKGKQKDALFTKEERNLLKDYEFLKKNGQI